MYGRQGVEHGGEQYSYYDCLCKECLAFDTLSGA